MKKSSLQKRNSITGILFISPWIIGFLLFFFKPFLQSVQFSFGSLSIGDAGAAYTFLGLQNYIEMLTENTTYPQLLVSSLKSIVLDVPTILVFAFFVAILLKSKFHGNGLAKAIFFLPVVMSSGFFAALLNNSSNINSAVDASISEASTVTVLQSVNLEQYLLEMGLSSKIIGYITAPVNNIYHVITMSGVQIFIFLAGLNAISPSLYEACYIEGAGAWETFWKITLPMMMPMVLVNTVFSIIDTFTSTGNAMMDYVYEQAFDLFRFGPSSAMCLLYVMAVLLIMGLCAWFINRYTFYYT